jgi:hypothetical protein
MALFPRGADERGAWVLWFESGEIDGGYVGGFRWWRVVRTAVLDPRCLDLGRRKLPINLPLALGLGANKTEVLKALGEPAFKDDERLIYLHKHERTISREPFTTSNIVMVRLKNGTVCAIQVSKDDFLINHEMRNSGDLARPKKQAKVGLKGINFSLLSAGLRATDLRCR